LVGESQKIVKFGFGELENEKKYEFIHVYVTYGSSIEQSYPGRIRLPKKPN
jgi:hypothetical protein